jgi:hypothetical protein
VSIKVQLDGRTTGQNADTLDGHAGRLWANPGRPILVVGEYIESERVQPREGLQKDARIRLSLEHCEVALNVEQEHLLRNAMRALNKQRTVSGTFDEITGGFEYDQQVLDTLEGGLDASEAVRARGGLAAAHKRLAEILRKNDRDYVRLRKESQALLEVMRQMLDEQLDPKTVAEAEFIAAAAKVEAEEAARAVAAQQRLDETSPEDDGDDEPEDDEGSS